MGARQAFDCRLEELVRGRDPAGDDEVVESFLADLVPGGDLTRYLAACQLAYRVGSTLFVHGSVTPENLGRVPGSSRIFDDVDAWAAALNGWYRAQVEAYIRGELGPGGDPLWAPLVAYQAPLPGTKLNQSSVVYARPTDDAGNPSLPPPRSSRRWPAAACGAWWSATRRWATRRRCCAGPASSTWRPTTRTAPSRPGPGSSWAKIWSRPTPRSSWATGSNGCESRRFLAMIRPSASASTRGASWSRGS